MIKTSISDLKKHLINDLKIKSTDVIFLFSGIWGLGTLDGGINIITDAFKKVLNSGLLVVPTFSYSWNQNKYWNIKEINCNEMGAYSCSTVNDKDFIRTNHPNFSVNFLKNKNNKDLINNFLAIDNDTFGENSIFGKIYNYSKQNRAFILLLGGAFNDVIYRSTFIHYAQQKNNSLHRYFKYFQDPAGSKRQINEIT